MNSIVVQLMLAAPHKESYATVVFAPELLGAHMQRGFRSASAAAQETQSACAAAVLGKALKSVDPSRARTVIVQGLLPSARRLLTDGGLWNLTETTEPLTSTSFKNALWMLPFGRVMYFDADLLPLEGADLQRAWSTPGRLLAQRDTGGVHRLSRCFNSGLMLLTPSLRSAGAVKDAAAAADTLSMEPYAYLTWRSLNSAAETRYNFSRCPLPPGSEQIPLNAHFKTWVDMPLAQANPWSCGGRGDSAKNFFGLDAYHAMLHTLPPHLGRHCTAAVAGRGQCKLPLSLRIGRSVFHAHPSSVCNNVHSLFAQQWWRHFSELPVLTRRVCSQAYNTPRREANETFHSHCCRGRSAQSAHRQFVCPKCAPASRPAKRAKNNSAMATMMARNAAFA
jgi:hypothetical protein